VLPALLLFFMESTTPCRWKSSNHHSRTNFFSLILLWKMTTRSIFLHTCRCKLLLVLAWKRNMKLADQYPCRYTCMLLILSTKITMQINIEFLKSFLEIYKKHTEIFNQIISSQKSETYRILSKVSKNNWAIFHSHDNGYMLLNAEMLHVHGNVVWEQREVRLCEGRGLSGILPGTHARKEEE
jgi:hypothetical protein